MNNNELNNEFETDLITLISDDGQEMEFEILDILEDVEGIEGKFYVLYPYYENPEDAVNDPGEYYIMKATGDEGEEELTEVEDDEILDKLADLFEARYYSEDNAEEETAEN